MIISEKLTEAQKLILKGIDFVQRGGVIINTGGWKIDKGRALKIAKEYKDQSPTGV